jgi:hypothetical protein
MRPLRQKIERFPVKARFLLLFFQFLLVFGELHTETRIDMSREFAGDCNPLLRME